VLLAERTSTASRQLMMMMMMVYCSKVNTVTSVGSAGVTLKCFPYEKSAQREIITKLICLPFDKISPATRKRLPPPTITGKNPSRSGGRRTGPIFTGKLSVLGVKRLFLGGSYNETPATLSADYHAEHCRTGRRRLFVM